MKITLMYNYNLEGLTIYRVNEQIYIKSGQNRYMLIPIKSTNELNELYTILNKYELSNHYYEIMKTKDNQLSILYRGIEYALLKIPKENNHKLEEKLKKVIELKDTIYILDRSNWYFLWSKKNDYMEYKYEHIKNKYKLIDETIHYYLGMSETAISYLNNTADINKKLTITHRRLDPEKINNPLNIIIDRKERDISEYLKYIFIRQINTPQKVKEVILNIEPNKYSFHRIYSRLLYPTYYFDIYDNIEIGIEREEKLQEIINRIDEYEIYLRDIYNIMTTKFQIKKIDWL